MSVLTIIPARGGSKRVIGKNMRIVGGHPMLWWTIAAAKDAGLTPVVSSESDEILTFASSEGCTCIRRPLALCADDASTESCLIHALDYMGLNWQWVLCLPPTSPLRTAATIRTVLERERPVEADCIMTTTEYRGDLWHANGKWLLRSQAGAPRRQQDRVPLWEENSACYLVRSQSLWMTKSVLGYGNVIGVPISKTEAWDVNDETDLMIADVLLRAKPQPPSRPG